MADNAELVRGLVEAWNNRDFDYIADCTAPDAVTTMVGTGATFQGPEGSRQYDEMWAGAFPDGKATIDRIFASGDVVAVEYTGKGTQTGPMVTGAGTIPATGRSVTLHLCDIYEIKDGKVQKQNVYLDSADLMTQLGVTAGQTAATK